MVPGGALSNTSDTRRLVAAKSISPDATTPSWSSSYTDSSGVTFTVAQYATSVTLSYSAHGSAAKVISSVTVDDTVSYFTTAALGYSSVNTSLTAPNSPVKAFNSTVTPTSSSTANYSIGSTKATGNTNYANGAANFDGVYINVSKWQAVPYGSGGSGGGCRDGKPCPLITKGQGVALGVGMTGVVGGIAALAEIGFAITPLGFAIACVLMGGALFGMFFDL